MVGSNAMSTVAQRGNSSSSSQGVKKGRSPGPSPDADHIRQARQRKFRKIWKMNENYDLIFSKPI